MPKQPASLKASVPNLAVAAPSSLAAGLNLQTVVSVQNHWREYYNPLRALDLPRAIALYDFSRYGLNAELQNCYREMEQLFPTLIALIERRTSPLEEMEWVCKPIEEDKLPPGATVAMAEAQAEAIKTAYSQIDNIEEAVEELEMASFRGYTHLEKIYANPGTSDLSIAHFEFVEQWHWTRKSIYSEWEYVAAATQTNTGVPINYDQFLIREVKRPIDRVALILWIRANLCEKDWDAFIEIYGIPHWIVVMPPNVPKEKETEYLTAAKRIAEGGSGALPNGADAKTAAGQAANGKDVFRPRLDWLQEQLVLAGTGGLLSMLAMSTGMNDSQGAQHADAFEQLGKKEARKISKVFNQQFDRFVIEDEFPGQPILARFELSTKEQTDPTQFVKDVGVLSTAGFEVDPAQIEEKTGYKVTIKAPPPAPIPGKDASPQASVGAEDPIKNRAGSNGPATDLLAKSLPSLVLAKHRDLAPLLDRMHGITELTDPRLVENAVRKLRADLNDPQSEIIQAAIKNPEAGKALADAMTAGLFNGIAQAEAAHPISAKTKNRRQRK